MGKDNLVTFQGGANPSITKEAIRQLREDIPNLLEYVILIAELTKAKYDALILQGFTEAQAIELSRHIF